MLGKMFFLMSCFYILTACASSPTTADFVIPINKSDQFCELDKTEVKVTTVDGIELDDKTKVNMAEIINNSIIERKSSIKCINGHEKRNYNLNTHIFTLDTGSRVSRLIAIMDDGMYIGAVFKLYNRSSPDTVLTEFNVFKSYNPHFLTRITVSQLYDAIVGLEDLTVALGETAADVLVASE